MRFFARMTIFRAHLRFFTVFVVEIVVDVVVIAVVVVINDKVECELRTKIVKNRKVDAFMYINKASILRQLFKNAQLDAAHLYAKIPLLFWLRNGNSCNIEKIPKPVRGRDANGCLPFTKIFWEIRFESKWSTTFWVFPTENFREQRNI